MSLQLSNTLKNAMLDSSFKPSGTFYVSAGNDKATESVILPHAEIVFNSASNGTISLAAAVQIAIPAGTNVDSVFLSTIPITNAMVDDVNEENSIYKIDLTGEDNEIYTDNGIYIVNTINISVNT